MLSNNNVVNSLQVQTTNRQIIQIAMPIAFSILVPQINFITNNIFLGGLNEQSLALAGITGVYYLIFAVIGIGLNNGLQALIARRAGEGRVGDIGSLFTQGNGIAMVFAILGIAVTWFAAPAIFRMSLSDPAHAQSAVDFLYIRIWGLPFLYLFQTRNALLVGTNQSKMLIVGTLAEAAANIFFDYGLIYGHFGLPEIGFNGAAFASVIAEAVGLAVLFVVMKAKGIDRQLGLHIRFLYNAVDARRILTLSAPLVLQYVLSITSWTFFYILIEHHGDRALAISNTMRNVFGLFGCIAWAFAATSNTMVSNLIGQGLHDRVIGLVWKTAKISLISAFVVFVLLNIFPQILLSVYGQGDDFIRDAIPVVRIVSAALLLQSVSVVWLNAVVGTGNSKMNLMTESVAIVIYCIYVYITLEWMQLPITWGWGSEWLYWACMFVPSFWYMMSGRWKGKKI